MSLVTFSCRHFRAWSLDLIHHIRSWQFFESTYYFAATYLRFTVSPWAKPARLALGQASLFGHPWFWSLAERGPVGRGDCFSGAQGWIAARDVALLGAFIALDLCLLVIG